MDASARNLSFCVATVSFSYLLCVCKRMTEGLVVPHSYETQISEVSVCFITHALKPKSAAP